MLSIFISEDMFMLNLKKQKRIKISCFLLSFLIPVLIMLLGLNALHITPFGDRTIVISDGFGLYINELSFIGRMVKGGEGILYSFKNGIGANMVSTLAWGMINPLFALSAFFSLEQLPEFYSFLTVLNLAVAGLTMYILLNSVFGFKASNLIFSTSYSLIGFSVVNDFQIVFFIGVQVLPLVALGLHRLIKGKSPLLYILSLAYAIFANFYFGYMLCAASLAMFIAYEAINGADRKLIKNYALSSLLGGLLPAFFWVPTMKALAGGRLQQTTASEFTFDENMPFLQIFAKLFTGANSTSEIVDGLPNIFCGILTVALVIIFFLKKENGKKKRAAAACVLGFYLITFYIVCFNLVMHGFTHTNWFPFRYSFVFSFLLIMLAAEQFQSLDEITLEDCRKCGAVLLILVIAVFSQKYEFISGGEVLLDLALLLLMYLGFRGYLNNREKVPYNTLLLLLAITVSANLYANYTLSTKKMMDWSMDLEKYEADIFTAGSIVDAVNAADDSFYRMENEYQRSGTCGMDSYLYGYNSVSHSASVDPESVRLGLQKLGINKFDMRNFYSSGINAATDSLLGIKYVISERDLSEEKGYENKVSLNDTTLYYNPFALDIAFLCNDEISGIELTEDVFENQNEIWKALTGGDENIFTQETDITFTSHSNAAAASVTYEELQEKLVEVENDEALEYLSSGGSYIEYSFTAACDGPVYMLNGVAFDSGYGLQTPMAEYIGSYKKGELVSGKIEIEEDYVTWQKLASTSSYYVFAYADYDVLKAYAEELKGRDSSVEKQKETLLTGTFEAEAGQRLFFSIAYDEGWSLYIDGEKAELEPCCEVLMSAAVPEGEHSYELRYFPAGMKTGIIISCLALAGLFVLLGRKEKQSAAELLKE